MDFYDFSRCVAKVERNLLAHFEGLMYSKTLQILFEIWYAHYLTKISLFTLPFRLIGISWTDTAPI